MYLKSIEVQGFKSFAHKIIFEFHNGITGIVGPNGSGKSNVADAVRWVLGEQSAKQLRGSKMEDIIFSGTENKKPQGFAFVALTIDNSDHKLAIDFPEVTVARRVYRSGESEYLLNGSPCRLKDVNELFYDTGIGKEGYSIIGQGQIDKILSGKPEERRELFDEAAGIVKFKRRKNEAIKKLEAEKQNLIRVEDILSELEKQVGPLKKQSEAAKQYLCLKEELKTYDINMFLLESASYKIQLGEVKEKLVIVKGDHEASKEKYDKIKAEYDKLQSLLDENSKKIEETQRLISQAQIDQEKQEGEIHLLEEQIRSFHMQNEAMNQRNAKIQEELQEKKKAEKEQSIIIQKLNSLLSDAEKKQEAVSKQLQDVKEALQNAQVETEKRKSYIIQLLNEKATIKTKIQRYDTMLEQIQIRRAELSRKLLEHKSNEALRQENIGVLEENLNQILSQIKEQQEKEAHLEGQIEKVHEQNLVLERKQNQLQQKYHADYSKLESLRNITERYEGYGNSIRRVMELKNQKNGIIGVVADIIKTGRTYETAIETALGGSIQNIVTDTQNTAKELIAYLKKNRFGRATFLPLDGIAVKNSLNIEKIGQEPGVLGVASTLVTVEKQYQRIAEYLLGRIIVTDHIDHAIALAKKYEYSLRIVTLEGELLNAGGSMTGGAFKNSGNLLGRRRETEELEKEVASLDAQLKETKEQIDKGKQENIENRKKLEDCKKSLQEQYIQQNTVKLTLSHAEEEKKELLSEYQAFQKESTEIEHQILEISDSREELLCELENLEKNNQSVEDEIYNLNEVIEEHKLQEGEGLKLAEETRIECANSRQKAEFAKENAQRLQKETDRLLSEQKELLQAGEHRKNEIEDKTSQISVIRKQMEALKKNQAEDESCLKQLTDEKEQLAERQRQGFQKREELSERITMLDKDVYRLTDQSEKIEEALAAGVHYMWEEYELTYSEAKEFRREELSNQAEIKKKITSLKGQIRNLGTVNVNAIEDYKEVSERYEFLKGQHDDLITAGETLRKIIEELDIGMREQFKEKFEEIRMEFDKVFKELFGGGKGTVELMEGEDILEAGIRIISQPPGKKLQNMMQLSGGEKALTAISLLFAIQNLKPSPFCLLDEIEAALDDSNVNRFAQYLHKLTKYTQFIVITHRRGTKIGRAHV